MLASIILVGCSGIINGIVHNAGERVTICYQQAMEYDALQVTLHKRSVLH